MALTFAIRAATTMLVIAAGSVPARAQAPVVEADVSVGHSTDGSTVSSTQVRTFGGNRTGWSFFGETALSGQTGGDSSAFSIVYPYDRRLRPMDVFVEKRFDVNDSRGDATVGIRAGTFTTPFGIYSHSDQAYSGFTRAPLVRYGEEHGLSDMFFETGADVFAGRPVFSVEGSIGAPRDSGDNQRRSGLDTVVRAQSFIGAFIVGVSHLRSRSDQPAARPDDHLDFTGVDGRWSGRGLQLRGEWLSGHAMTGLGTSGGYLDAILHRAVMGPVTVVGRIERISTSGEAEGRDVERRLTAGTRIRLSRDLSAQIALVHQPGGIEGGRATALDAGLTFSIRR